MMKYYVSGLLGLMLLGMGRLAAQTSDHPLSAIGPGWYQPYSWTAPAGTGMTRMTSHFPGFFSAAAPASAARIAYTQLQMQYSMRAHVWLQDSFLWRISGRPAHLALAIPLRKKGGWGLYAQLTPLAKAGRRWTIQHIDSTLPVQIMRIHKGALQELHFGLAWRPIPQLAFSAGPTYIWGLYQSQDEFNYPDTLTEYWDVVAIEHLRLARWSWTISADLQVNTGEWKHQLAIAFSPEVPLQGQRVIDEGLVLGSSGNVTRIRTDTVNAAFTFPSRRRIGYSLMQRKRRFFIEYEQSTAPGPSTAFRFGTWTQAFQKISLGYEWAPDRAPASFFHGFRYGLGAYHTRQPFTHLSQPVQEQGLTFGTSFQAGNSPSRINAGMQLGRLIPTNKGTHWVAHFHIGINIADKWFQRPYWE